jgi:hypothetical protein
LTIPAAETSAAIFSASSVLIASGFSQKTGNLRPIASATRRGCSLVHVQT